MFISDFEKTIARMVLADHYEIIRIKDYYGKDVKVEAKWIERDPAGYMLAHTNDPITKNVMRHLKPLNFNVVEMDRYLGDLR